MKTCAKCKETLPLNRFSKDCTTKSGYKSRCKDCIDQYNREYYALNKQKENKRTSAYKKANRSVLRVKEKEYYDYRRKTDINYRLRHYMRGRTNRLINSLRLNKGSSLYKNLGCSMDQLKQHIESLFKPGMSWDNYGEWHIDHIKPLASFDLKDNRELKKAAHYTNLQPLWAIENLKKGAKV